MTAFYIAVGTRQVSPSEAMLVSVLIWLTKADKKTRRQTQDVLKVVYRLIHVQKHPAQTVGEQIVKVAHGQISKNSFSAAKARYSKHFPGL